MENTVTVTKTRQECHYGPPRGGHTVTVQRMSEHWELRWRVEGQVDITASTESKWMKWEGF